MTKKSTRKGRRITGNKLQSKVNEAILSSEGVKIGARTGDSYLSDPKHLLFNMARYKFTSKMLAGLDHVLEVGCGDGFGTAIVAHTVKKITAADLDARFIAETNQAHPYSSQIDFVAHDMIKQPFKMKFDAAFALDVLEHIEKRYEARFLQNITKSLKTDGVCIIGMPSLESQRYASPLSKLGHVNCKTGAELKAFLDKYFKRVFMFSMNDEVVHTGFFPMAHYIFALCVFPRKV